MYLCLDLLDDMSGIPHLLSASGPIKVRHKSRSAATLLAALATAQPQSTETDHKSNDADMAGTLLNADVRSCLAMAAAL